MSTDASSKLPRKKPSVLWWLAGFLLFLVLLFFVQLFGPNPPIIVSPQTTYITEPLAPNGLPDYERHILEQSRDGVTPENNAVVLLWQAMFPADVDPAHHAATSQALGLAHIPLAEDALERPHSETNRQRIAAFLAKRLSGNGTDPLTDGYYLATSEQVLEHAMTRPWAGAELPPLAGWVAANKGPLDLIVQASRRPRYYAPSTTLLDNNRDMLIAILLPHVQSTRDAGRALSIRAMWHLGEGRIDEAWDDVLAIHRLARLVSQGHFLVEQLVALGISNMACGATAALLSDKQLTLEQATMVQRDLAALPNFADMARSLDKMERLAALDAFMHVGGGSGGEAFAAITGNSTDNFSNNAFSAVSIDWNFVLRQTNRWYDRLAEAARMPDRAARETALQQIEADIQQLAADTRQPGNWAAAVISRRERSQVVSGIMLSLFLPAVTAATNAEDRGNANLELTRTAAALAIHRANSGSYPETLQELVPATIDQLPLDPYTGGAFVYKRAAGGYLLYSVGENGTDDGGSNERDRTLNGQPINDFDELKADSMSSQIPPGADDISIRVPRPAFELPKMPAPSE